MHKLSITKPKTHTIKLIVLIALALGLCAWGIVLYQQHRVKTEARDAAVAKAQVQHDRETNSTLNTQKAVIQVLSGDKLALCQYIAAETARPKVAVPTTCKQ